MKKIEDYLHLYLGQRVEVATKHDPTKKVLGGMYEVSNNGGNHSALIQVNFDELVDIFRDGMYQSSNMHHFFISDDHIKLMLRPLSDMSEDEENEIEGEWGNYGFGDHHLCNALKYETYYVKNIFEVPDLFLYLLKRGFDLFGLIDAELAIDKTTLQ
jgi:hypothetical protein